MTCSRTFFSSPLKVRRREISQPRGLRTLRRTSGSRGASPRRSYDKRGDRRRFEMEASDAARGTVQVGEVPAPGTPSELTQIDRARLTPPLVLKDLLEKMLMIRRFEEKAAELYSMGKIGGFCHLYIGQEAVGVGAISTLGPDDYILASYREHGQALARGLDPGEVMAEL